MNGYNKVIIMGNLTRDIELRYTGNGTAVTDIGVAINSRKKDKSNETVFVDVTVWDKQAENCAEYLSKGSPVHIEGRLTLDQWEKDGQKYSKLKVTAISVQFLPSGEKRERSSTKSATSDNGGDDDSFGGSDEIPF